MKCLNCSTPFFPHRFGRPKKYCSKKCADSWNHEIRKSRKPIEKVKICKGCNLTFIVPQSSHLEYCSKNCYPAQIRPPKDCNHCGAKNAIYRGRLFCDTCIVARRYARRIHSAENAESHRKGIRLTRERMAPGLGSHQRMMLLKSWKAERQPCSYCFNLADTIDYIIPLSRNGTNYENNLIPACRSCNSSKANKLISEWKVLNVGSST
jgi:5-methylcytosine-specific restriction endonuclease McrA